MGKEGRKEETPYLHKVDLTGNGRSVAEKNGQGCYASGIVVA